MPDGEHRFYGKVSGKLVDGIQIVWDGDDKRSEKDFNFTHLNNYNFTIERRNKKILIVS